MWQGAEARVEVVSMPAGITSPAGPASNQQKQVIKKTRFSKQYRHPDLDKRLTRQRTVNEARALYRAHLKGLPVPLVLWSAPDLGILLMTRVGGDGGMTVKEALWRGVVEEEWLAEEIGSVCARLHANDLVHGDLTTSNFIYSRGDDSSTPHEKPKVYIIDFGLSVMSTSVEDKAVDLYVLERAIQSTHSVQHPLFFTHCMAAYERYLCECDEKMWSGIKKRFEEVRARGRKRM